MEGDDLLIEGKLAMARAKHLLRDAIDDIADAIEVEASRQAPRDTGELKAHPVDREDTRISITPSFYDSGFGARTNIPAFGGGTSVRGPKGRFVKPSLFREPFYLPGELIGRSVITIAEEPKYAIWVHDGTGIYRRGGTPIVPHTQDFMLFPASKFPTARFKRATYRFASVLGQRPQPYLVQAYLLVNGTYVPARITLLRAQMAAEL